MVPKDNRTGHGGTDPVTDFIIARPVPDVAPNWRAIGGIFARIIDRLAAQRDDDQDEAA